MKNILLVDDNNYFLIGLSMSLGVYLKDYNILTAGNGRKAMEIMGALPVYMVVSDLEMPHMNGDELTARVNKAYPNLPVLLMTDRGAREAGTRPTAPTTTRLIEKSADFKKLAGIIAAELVARVVLAA